MVLGAGPCSVAPVHHRATALALPQKNPELKTEEKLLCVKQQFSKMTLHRL